jgi:hypothetical protein
MAVSVSRKLNAAALTFVFVVGLVAAFAPALFAARELQQFCEALPLGAPAAEVQSRATERDYALTKLDDGSFAVEHPGSLGRLECQLRFDEKGQLASKARPP